MTPYCAVAGTWGYRPDADLSGAWWQHDSPFARFLRQNECAPVGYRPFVWSTRVGGFSLRRGGKFTDWAAGGEALRNYFESPTHPACPFDVPLTDRRVIAHSHGGQVVLHACAQGLRIHTLITIGTPVRDDMKRVMEQARVRIGWWLHVSDHSITRNMMQWLGAVGDGHLGGRWTMPLADVSLGTPGVGHSALLYDPSLYHRWYDDGLLDTLKRK